MTITTENSLRPITAPLNFISENPKYELEEPYLLVEIEPTPEVPETNIEFDTHNVLVKDIRAHIDVSDIGANGFKLVDWPSQISMTSNFQEIETYCKDMAEMLKKELNAEKVLVFDFRFRSNHPEKNTPLGMYNARALGDKCTPIQGFSGLPVQKAHVDQTNEGGLRRVRTHMTNEESSKYLDSKYRVRVVNIWRSFNTTAQDMPLAFCLPHTIGTDDPVVVKAIEPNKVGENYYLRYSKQQEWFWASNMRPNEAFIFSTWDSMATEKVTNCAYHTAFMNPLSPTSPRESLEIRTIVINAL